MHVVEITDEKVWEELSKSIQPNNFLASWKWGDFNEALGYPIFRIGLYDGQKLIGACLAIKIVAKVRTFLLCPSGPILQEMKKEPLFYFLGYLKRLAQTEKCDFLRIRPLIAASEENKKLIQDFGFRDAPAHVHAEVSWILDLREGEETLLANMRKTTRYLIRQAEKLGVRVSSGDSKADLDQFEQLQEKTVERKHFVPFSSNYLRKEVETFRPSSGVKIFKATYKGEVLASAIIVFYGSSAFYHHGSSITTKIPASYLLQWEAIKVAKKSGCEYYNFWGIAPGDDPNHPWAGLTLFKQGFGGFRKDYLHAQDLPLSAKYLPIYWFEKIRQRSRGLSY